MPVPVFFMDARSNNSRTSSIAKVRSLLAKAAESSPEAIRKGDLCAVKIHFGESGNDAYMSPVLAKGAADLAKAAGAKPFFTDTNTLYTGSRGNAVDHLETAISHGFVPEVCGAPVVIADGLRGDDWREAPLPAACSRFKSAKIAGAVASADSMIVLTHVKGHEMAGMGGAIKNLAMGCAPPAGKREQHSLRYKVSERRCVACGSCSEVCPTGAALAPGSHGDKAFIVRDTCIGCGECVIHCAPGAISMDWESDLAEFTERMTEYALGAMVGKAGRAIFLSVVQRVSPICDCAGWSDIPVVPDLGFLASIDPVAIDKAAFDLVKAAPVWPGSALDGKAGPGVDKFAALHPGSLPELQMEYGERIGLGSRDYELVKL